MRDELSGHRLHGDAFSPSEIEEWFRDETEGYADLVRSTGRTYRYAYHALNHLHGFRHLPQRPYRHVLSVGGAYAEELRPILHHIERITVLEPTDAFDNCHIDDVPIEYLRAVPRGRIALPDASVDLVTCFGTLHHIANVSTVVREMGRVTTPNGYALIREPIISMGDWRQQRRGLTKRERGIPRDLLRRAAIDAGFVVERESLCMFPLTIRAKKITKTPPYNPPLIVALDRIMARAWAWNERYHAEGWRKLRPTNVFLVLRKA